MKLYITIDIDAVLKATGDQAGTPGPTSAILAALASVEDAVYLYDAEGEGYLYAPINGEQVGVGTAEVIDQ